MKFILVSLVYLYALTSNLSNAQYFKSWQGILYDPNGKEFIIKGVNIQQMEQDYQEVGLLIILS